MDPKYKALLSHINYDNYSLSVNDKLFIERIYSTSIDKYQSILKRIGFDQGKKVLDAGCGFGQWSIAMHDLGNHVTSIDINENRIKFLQDIINKNELKNFDTSLQGIDDLNFPENHFDHIFCYATFFIADCKKALRSFKRCLKPGGQAYITFNSIGYYIYLWETEKNKTSDYSPRKVVVKAMENAITYFEEGYRVYGDMVISKEQFIQMAKEVDLEVTFCGPDGDLNRDKYPNAHFYDGLYKGLESNMEILLTKKA